MANMSDKVAEISDPTHHTSLMASLRDFISSESFVDVQFICQGGHKVYAHKLMLISISRLLKELLKENPDSKEMITIHLPDVNSKHLRIVFNFLYSGFMRLNNVEMDQFKIVLGLLDITIFQKNPADNSSDVKTELPVAGDKLNGNKNNPPTNNNYASNNNSVPMNVVNAASVPIVNRVGPPQNLQTQYVPVAQPATQVTGVPVDSGTPQYIAIRTDQLSLQNSPAGVVFSLPLHSGSNMVVQQNSQGLSQGHQIVQDPNQFNTYSSNVINSPVAATHIANTAVPSNVVPVNTMTQLQSPQVNVQHVSTLPGQQIVQLVPTTQTVVNNNASFSAPMEQPHPISSNLPSNSKDSSLPVEKVVPGVIRNIVRSRKIKTKASKRKSIQPSKPAMSGVIIDLSDDDEIDYKKQVAAPLSVQNKRKVRKQSLISKTDLSSPSTFSTSSSPLPSSSSHLASRRTPTAGSNSSRKKENKDIVNVDIAGS